MAQSLLDIQTAFRPRVLTLKVTTKALALTVPRLLTLAEPIILTIFGILMNRPDAKTEEELRNCAREGNDAVSLEASVDGLQLKNLRDYRITSNLSNFTISSNNPFGFAAGNTQVIVDGYFLFLKPLSPGEHTIHFSGSIVDNPTTGTQSFATEVTYHLTVK